MNRKGLIEILLLWGLCGGAWALTSDPEQPLNIEADSADVDEPRGVTVYEGGVVMTQGTIRIRADKVTIHSDEEGLSRAVLEGNPARFRQKPDGSAEYVRASARTIEFVTRKNLVHLIDGAKVTQGEDKFSGNRIDYDTRLNRVKARASKSGGERVRITFTPKKTSGAEAREK